MKTYNQSLLSNALVYTHSTGLLFTKKFLLLELIEILKEHVLFDKM